MYVCVYIYIIYMSAYRGQKRLSNFLELEWQMVVSYNADPSTEPGLLNEEQVFLSFKSSLQALMLKL